MTISETTLRYQSELINKLRKENDELKKIVERQRKICDKLQESIKDYQAISMLYGTTIQRIK